MEAVRAKIVEFLGRMTSDEVQHCFEQQKAGMQRYIDRGKEMLIKVTCYFVINDIFLDSLLI